MAEDHIPDNVRTLLDALYAKLDEPPKPLEKFRLEPKPIQFQALPVPTDPDKGYPWLSSRTTARYRAMSEEDQDAWAMKFRTAYGFDWWTGPISDYDDGK